MCRHAEPVWSARALTGAVDAPAEMNAPVESFFGHFKDIVDHKACVRRLKN